MQWSVLEHAVTRGGCYTGDWNGRVFLPREGSGEAQEPSIAKHLGVGDGIGADPITGHGHDYACVHRGRADGVRGIQGRRPDYFAADKQAMINLRLRDLDGLLAKLREAGIAITQEQEMEGVGRFARVLGSRG